MRISRKAAFAAAASVLLATSSTFAQTAPEQTPTSRTRVTRQDSMTNSGLLLMLGAIAGAVLLTILATQIGGDDPASP